ncbi:MAG: pseudouridine synthase [Salinivirgaceae bacterium]|nr:pseudouridine synthase [Salinivirgaceae bacterium]
MNSNQRENGSSEQERRPFNGDHKNQSGRSKKKNEDDNETKIDFDNPNFWEQIEKEIFNEEESPRSAKPENHRDQKERRYNDDGKPFEQRSNNRSPRFDSKDRNDSNRGFDKKNNKSFIRHEDNAAERKPYTDRSSYENRDNADRDERRESHGERTRRTENREPNSDRGEREKRGSFSDRGEREKRTSYNDREKRDSFNEGNERERRTPYADRSERDRRESHNDRNERGEREKREPYNGKDRERRQPFDRNEREKRTPYTERDERDRREPLGERDENDRRFQKNHYDKTDTRRDSLQDRRTSPDDRDSRYDKPKKSFQSERNERPPYKGKGSSDNPYSDAKPIRLNRFISNAGVCSRRGADDLILAGEITVNGKVVTELGCKVSYSDEIIYRGRKLDAQKKVYLVLNKPKDTLSTFDDPEGRRTVYDIIEDATKERIYSVGRLDRNTTGVLLFTNNGDMAAALTHPSNNIKKLYHVVLNKDVTKDHLNLLLEGFDLEDGRIEADVVSYANDVKNEIGIEIHSGRNRVVRRMFEHLGYEVVRLDRVSFAGLTKKSVPRGTWRLLESNEVNQLHMLIGKSKSEEKELEKSKKRRPRIEKEKKEFKHERRSNKP